MGVSKVEFAGNTLIDLTGDTVQPTSLVAGYTATNSAGEKIEGEFIPIYLDGEGNIKSMFEDAEKTKVIFPRTKTSAISDGDGKSLDIVIEELKKSVSDGKTLVANAITEKGVSTSSDDTFETMATNILAIESGSDEPTKTVTTRIGIYTLDVSGTNASIRVWVEEDGVQISQTDYKFTQLTPTPVNIADIIQIDYGVTTSLNYTVKALKDVECNGIAFSSGDVVTQWHYTFNANVVIVSEDEVPSSQSGEPVFVTSSKMTSAGWATSDVFTTDAKTLVYPACFKVYRGTTNENVALQGSTDNSTWTEIERIATGVDYGLIGGWFKPVKGYPYYRIQCAQSGGSGSECRFTFMYMG